MCAGNALADGAIPPAGDCFEASRRATLSRMADIIELVYADPRLVASEQFSLLDDTKSDDELAAVWDLLSTGLDAHADAEETVFSWACSRSAAATSRNLKATRRRDGRRHHRPQRDSRCGAPVAQAQAGERRVIRETGMIKARTENGEHLDEEEREAMQT